MTFATLVEAAENMGLTVNEGKTKVMASTTGNRARNIGQNMTIDDYNLEVVQTFTYLGSSVNNKNNMSEEIKRRIVLANKCYFELGKRLKRRQLSFKTKLMLYKTLILPVLTYGSETWTLSKADETLLLTFERKILRRIFGAVCDNGVWRRRYNFELYEKYKQVAKGRDVVTSIRIGRLRWAGHVNRADDNYPPKKIMVSEPVGARSRGRPRLRWKDGVEEDARKIGARNWKQESRNRQEWRKKLEKVGAHIGL